MKKRIRIIIPIAIVLAATVVWLVLRNGRTANAPLMASGTVEATQADLGFEVPGRILEITAREGDSVSAGAELARLDTRQLRAGLEGARAQLAAAEARLTELERGARPEELATAEASVRSATEQAQEAASEAERARTLFDGGAISRQALDRAQTAQQVAAAALQQTREQLALLRAGARVETIEAQRAVAGQASAAVSSAEAALANAVVTAPFAGIVTVRHRERGETVAPGAPALTVLDPNDRWVRIYIPEDQMGLLRIGLAAQIVSDTYPGRIYEGEIVFIGSQAEFTPRNVQTTAQRIKLVYPIKVRITGDPGFELKPGLPADVTFPQTGT